MEASGRVPGWKSTIRGMTFLLSLVIAFTSLVDLFINRLLFRSGPDALAHMNFDATGLAVLGRISVSLEQLVLFVVFGALTILLLREPSLLPRMLGAVFGALTAGSALLYASLPAGLDWAVSLLIVLLTGATVVGLAYMRVSAGKNLPGRRRIILYGLLVPMVLSFLFPIYYRFYLLAGALGFVFPFGLASYQAGLYSVMGVTIAALAYALTVPAAGYKLTARSLAKAALLPTLVVVPMVYGLMESFFITQIFTMVVAMSTDLILTVDWLRVLVALWWFLMTAIMLLLFKGRTSRNRYLIQQAIGLVLLMSTTFLFGYPQYLLLGIAGLFLITYPLSPAETD